MLYSLRNLKDIEEQMQDVPYISSKAFLKLLEQAMIFRALADPIITEFNINTIEDAKRHTE